MKLKDWLGFLLTCLKVSAVEYWQTEMTDAQYPSIGPKVVVHFTHTGRQQSQQIYHGPSDGYSLCNTIGDRVLCRSATFDVMRVSLEQ